MESRYDTYTSPLAERNASPEMLRLWSPRHKFNTWRRIWLAVAEAQYRTSEWKELKHRPPLVTKEQLDELREVVERPGGITDEEIERAKKYEGEVRHDVMSHVHALGDACPKAKGIIHLGMTSQDVVCNADFVVHFESLWLIQRKALRVFFALADFARRTVAIPTLGFTHYQPAQPVTVGRRAIQWAADLNLTIDRIKALKFQMEPRGFKGATGTQASFKALLDDPPYWQVQVLESNALLEPMIRMLNHALTQGEDDEGSICWDNGLDLTGQTYPRVIDTYILADLAAVACVLHKIATDIRLLCNRKEIDEPFEDKQIGSSAMPYKRNPMRCERICGLSRFVMNLVGNAYDTAATQWLERTLDDSSNRRLSLAEAFLALDGALDLMHNVASGLIVHEAMVRRNLMAELPFMATENILMACVKAGGDRQHYHELIRVHAQAAGLRVKQEGLDNDLLDRLKADRNFWSTARGGPLSAELDWEGVMDPSRYIGYSIDQTEFYLEMEVGRRREGYGEAVEKLGTSGPRV